MLIRLMFVDNDVVNRRSSTSQAAASLTLKEDNISQTSKLGLEHSTKTILEIIEAANNVFVTLTDTTEANLEAERWKFRTAQVSGVGKNNDNIRCVPSPIQNNNRTQKECKFRRLKQLFRCQKGIKRKF